MLPENEDSILQDEIEIEEISNFTYCMNIEKKQIVGTIDDLEAIKQAVYIMLNVERMDYEIYSDDFGVEFDELIGEPIPYVLSELKRRITECLTYDDRIEDVDEFEFEVAGGNVHATFYVYTIFGKFESEVDIDV